MSSPGFDFNATDGKVTSPARLAHVVLLTNQLDVMERFYLDFLGGSTVHKASGQICFITCDDEHHRIALLQMPNLKDKDPATCGLHVCPKGVLYHSNFLQPYEPAIVTARRAKAILLFSPSLQRR